MSQENKPVADSTEDRVIRHIRTAAQNYNRVILHPDEVRALSKRMDSLQSEIDWCESRFQKLRERYEQLLEETWGMR